MVLLQSKTLRKKNKNKKEESVLALLKAVKQQHPEALYLLGRAYYLGEGVEKNYKFAAGFLQEAANLDHPKAENLLRMLLKQ